MAGLRFRLSDNQNLLLIHKKKKTLSDYDRNSVEIPIIVRSSLSDNENKQLMDKLYKEQISHIAAKRDGRDSEIFCGFRKIQKGWMLHDTQLSIIQLKQRLNSKILSL